MSMNIVSGKLKYNTKRQHFTIEGAKTIGTEVKAIKNGKTVSLNDLLKDASNKNVTVILQVNDSQ